jgi:hypothetical protein
MMVQAILARNPPGSPHGTPHWQGLSHERGVEALYPYSLGPGALHSQGTSELAQPLRASLGMPTTCHLHQIHGYLAGWDFSLPY